MPPDQLKQIIRENIRARRAEQGLTQADLAILMGVTAPAISQIERGYTSLSVEMLAKIADALAVQPSMLLVEHAFVASGSAA